jgi:MSHA biogenesis protein MshI
MKIPFLSKLFSSKSSNGGWFALDIGAGGVHCAQIQFAGAMPKVVRCEYHQTGAVTADVLEKLSREAHFANSHLTNLLQFGEYQILMVEAPVVPADELKTAIRWKIKDGLSFHVDDATVDVLQIPKQGGERVQSLYAVAAENKTIQKCIALFERAKLALSVIDIRETAQRNIAALFEKDGFAVVLLTFDDKGGLLTFTAGGELYLARRIEISASQLIDANEELRVQSHNRVELELRRSLDYFDRQYNHLPISRVLVCAPAQFGLAGFLSSMVDVRVEPLNLAQVMDISDVPMLNDSEFLIDALPVIGAALRQERRAL